MEETTYLGSNCQTENLCIFCKRIGAKEYKIETGGHHFPEDDGNHFSMLLSTNYFSMLLSTACCSNFSALA